MVNWKLWEGDLPSRILRLIPGHHTHMKEGGKTHKCYSYTYSSWRSTIRKLFHEPGKNAERWKCYEDIGICARWVEGDGEKCGFLCFLEDMGERPEGTTINRKNPFGHYTPSNCEWADAKQQARDKRKKQVA